MPAPKVVLVREAKPHIEEAHRNYLLYQRFLEEPASLDWALVVLFYSALHLVQAHALSKGKIAGINVPKTHLERDNYVDDHLGDIRFHYRILREASEDARYDLVKRTREEVIYIHDKHFLAVKNYLEKRGFAWLASTVSNDEETA